MITKFDKYLITSDFAALTICENLIPAEGKEAVIFPSTYASGPGFRGGYNIDSFNDKTSNVCLVDSVGSQNNRIEPIFKCAPYRELVPQIIIEAGSKQINLLDAGHRAGDAIVRCSQLHDSLSRAFTSVLTGDYLPLAKIAPTSLIFGVWDSRETGAKIPRLVASVIRAYNVRELHRSAQYFPAVNYTDIGEDSLSKPRDLTDREGKVKQKHPFAQRGFVEVPATASHGGVIADGGIRRDATLALAALRFLKVGNDESETLKLQRYILGLALVAFTAPIEAYLRQGCLLVGDTDCPPEFNEVKRSGERLPLGIAHEQAIEFAQSAAKDFGIGESKTVKFDKKKAAADLKKKES